MLETVKTAAKSGNSDSLNQKPAEPCAVLLDLATPELFMTQPFRRTGLPALASVRDVSKRVDELKLSAELQAPVFQWSFAPEPAPTLDDIREATQVLKDPRVRLVYEFFWFWPVSFPADKADRGIEALGRGDTMGAWEVWRKDADSNEPIAVHNLAVYYQLLALDLERSAAPSEAQLRYFWRQALIYWAQVLAKDFVWDRLRARIMALGDAQVPVDFARQLRFSLPSALAKICTSLALRHAEAGRKSRAEIAASMVGRVPRSDSLVRRAMESCVLPVLRRVDRRVLDARNDLSKNRAAGLTVAALLLRRSSEDLRLVATLRQGVGPLYLELANTVVSAALDAAVDYQRVTLDNAGCVAILRRLGRMEMLPESRQRLDETYAVIRRNAEEEGPAVEWFDKAEAIGASLKAAPHEAYGRIATELIPMFEGMTLTELARVEYANELALMLHQLAVVESGDWGQFESLGAMLQMALQLPAAADVRECLEADWAALQSEQQALEQKALHIETETDTIEIDARGIRHNEQWVTPETLTGFRHGLYLVADGDTQASHYLVAWQSAEVEVALDCNLLLGDEAAEAGYQSILNSFYYFLTQGLISRIVFSIRGGQIVYLGDTPLTKHGMQFTAEAFLWKKEAWIPYSNLQHSIEDGCLTVANMDNPKAKKVYSLGLVWNASIMGHVIDALAAQPS